MMCSSEVADPCASVRSSRCSSLRLSESSTSAVNPMMPFIGVRITWLMLARNWLLMALACSACCRASSSSRDCA